MGSNAVHTNQEIPPALSEAQRQLLASFTRSFDDNPQASPEDFASLVIQQMDHLIAVGQANLALLQRLEAALKQHEEVHKQTVHANASTAPKSTAEVWADGVQRQHQPKGLE